MRIFINIIPMKPILIPLLSLLLLIFTFGATAQNDSGRFEFSLATAHPNAKALMKEEFFWSPIDETAIILPLPPLFI